MNKITIAGAGLVGSLLSILLAKRGYKVRIFEKRPDIRKATIAGGRSINLVISDRGWRALEAAGIKEEIRKITVSVYGRMTHDIEGKETFLSYSSENKAIYSVSRAELNSKLMDLAEKYSNVELNFNCQCEEADIEKKLARFQNTESGEVITVDNSIIFGADGANSVIRKSLQAHFEKEATGKGYSFTEDYIDHGYKELIIPPNPDGSWKLDKNALHIWPRKKYMLMALANLDGGFTCTLFFPFKGNPSFESIQSESDLLKFFKEVFPDALPLMPTLVEDYFSNPSSSLVIVKCNPWVYKSNVALIGDAAHAIVPFYGEGMNCGFEDCLVLDNLIEQYGDNWEEILSRYHKARKPNGDAIADLSMRNFIEMRDLVADPKFLLRKKIERKMHQKFPDKWVPLYSQVKFSKIPYADALKEGQRQDVIMENILSMEGIEEKWDSREVEDAILNLI